MATKREGATATEREGMRVRVRGNERLRATATEREGMRVRVRERLSESERQRLRVRGNESESNCVFFELEFF